MSDTTKIPDGTIYHVHRLNDAIKTLRKEIASRTGQPYVADYHHNAVAGNKALDLLRAELAKLSSGAPAVTAGTARLAPGAKPFPIIEPAASAPKTVIPLPIASTPTPPVARTAKEHLEGSIELEKVVAGRSFEKAKAQALAAMAPRTPKAAAAPERQPSPLASAYAAVFGDDELVCLQRRAKSVENEHDLIRRSMWGRGIKVPGEDFGDLNERLGPIDPNRFVGALRNERRVLQSKLDQFLKSKP